MMKNSYEIDIDLTYYTMGTAIIAIREPHNGKTSAPLKFRECVSGGSSAGEIIGGDISYH